jgi:hypothetical protein
MGMRPKKRSVVLASLKKSLIHEPGYIIYALNYFAKGIYDAV